MLMVLGHTSIPQPLSNFIFAFHMPLFFIASGWTTNWEKLSLVEFLKRRTRTLLLPFIIYSMIVLGIMIAYGWYSISNWLVKGWGDGYALWFIPVLFFAGVTCRIFWYLGKGCYRWLAIIIFLTGGIVLRYHSVLLPWNLSSLPYATFLIALGTEMRARYELLIPLSPRTRLYVALLCLLVVIGISNFIRLDICFNNILPIIPKTIGAIAGTVMVFIFYIMDM